MKLLFVTSKPFIKPRCITVRKTNHNHWYTTRRRSLVTKIFLAKLYEQGILEKFIVKRGDK